MTGVASVGRQREIGLFHQARMMAATHNAKMSEGMSGRSTLLRAGALALALAATAAWAAPTAIERDGMEYEAPGIAAASTEASLVLDGATIPYRASWSEHVLSDDDGAPLATLSAISYERLDLAAGDARPVVFAFNGGPGASSTPLHFSGFGPRRRVDDPAGGQRLVDNRESLLDVADLVFIDPVGTGFSRMASEDGRRFLGVGADGEAVAGFIRAWLVQRDRQGSPVYVMGESYGGVRLGQVVEHLDGLNVDGLVLVSPATGALNDSDQHHVFALPTMAATAAFHGRGTLAGQPPAQVWEQARRFAEDTYLRALQQGIGLPQAEKAQVAEAMSGLTGLPAQMILDANLRVDSQAFLDSVVPGKVVGRVDTRVAREMPREALVEGRSRAADDPALGLGASNVIRSAQAREYLVEDIGVRTDRDYYALNLNLNFNWNWCEQCGASGMRMDSHAVAPRIATTMQHHPDLRVLLFGGYYDFATPLLGQRYALTRGDIPADRLVVGEFAAPHTPFNEEVRAEVAELVRGFVRGGSQ